MYTDRIIRGRIGRDFVKFNVFMQIISCRGLFMIKKLLIFDLDGTILDTLEDLTDSVNYALTHNYFPSRTIEEVKAFVGNGIHKLIERAVPDSTQDEKIEKVFADFKTFYAKHCADKTRPYLGINELFEELKERGCTIAVVSNKADFAVQDLCKQYFPNRIDIATGEKEGIKRKPSSDGIDLVLSKLNIRKENAIYIGDSEVDIQTAQNARLDMIAVAWGFREEVFLKENGAKCIVHTPNEILEYIQ